MQKGNSSLSKLRGGNGCRGSMEPDEFLAAPKQQVGAILQTLANDDFTLLELFVVKHNPQTNIDMSTDLETALSNTDFFNKILTQAPHRPDLFVALMRLWSRISKSLFLSFNFSVFNSTEPTGTKIFSSFFFLFL